MRNRPKVKKDVGYVLRVYRAERDLTRTGAAESFNVSPSHWSLMEDGERHASPELAQRLSDATGAPIQLFLGVMKTWDAAK